MREGGGESASGRPRVPTPIPVRGCQLKKESQSKSKAATIKGYLDCDRGIAEEEEEACVESTEQLATEVVSRGEDAKPSNCALETGAAAF